MKKDPFNNAKIINSFSVSAISGRLPKIKIQSNEKTANAVRNALTIDSNFWDDIQRDFSNYPTVQTTILL